jgi:hypothetical protein
LSQAGLIRALQRRIGGKQAGSDGFAWHLAPAGQRLLSRQAATGAAGAGNPTRLVAIEPSSRMAGHGLAVTEVYVRLREAERAGQLELLEVMPEPACWRSYLGAGGGRLTLKPDLFAITALPGSQFMDCWFIEVDMGSESAATLAGKAQVYESYRQTGLEQQRLGVFPLVLWLTPDQARADRIAAVVRAAGRVEVRLHRAVPLDQVLTVVTGLDWPASVGPSNEGGRP